MRFVARQCSPRHSVHQSIVSVLRGLDRTSADDGRLARHHAELTQRGAARQARSRRGIASSDTDALERLTERGPLNVVGGRIILPEITPADWLGALRDGFARLEVEITETTLQTLIELTRGHPYLTMRLARDSARIAGEDPRPWAAPPARSSGLRSTSCAATRCGRLFMTTPTIERLHAGLLALLAERIETDPLILGARVGMGSPALAAELLRETAGFMLDPIAAGGDPGLLAQQLTQKVITRVQPLPVTALEHPGHEPERARVQLGRYYSSDFAPALAAATGPADSEWTITRGLGPSPGNPLLAVRDAHLLPSTVL
ncbi:MAG: hypothetical protein ABSG43_19275 [Solirubrobacteraceae bacterium]|jgi:hypothetical protein